MGGREGKKMGGARGEGTLVLARGGGERGGREEGTYVLVWGTPSGPLAAGNRQTPVKT